MALALDMAAALAVSNKCGTDMDNENRGSCTGCCADLYAYDPYLFGSKEEIQAMLNKRGDAANAAHPNMKADM